MFGEIREGTGGKGEGMIEGEVVEEMRKNEGQGAQDRNMTSFPRQLLPRNCRSQCIDLGHVLHEVFCPDGVERVRYVAMGALCPLIDV